MTFYVSSERGNDGNAGSKHRPFRTLEQAQAAVRKAIVKDMRSDVIVFLRQGRYYLERPLRFDRRDSGRNGHRVIYRSFPGEQVELVGGTLVKGWQADSGGVYKARVGRGRVFHALFENDEWCQSARAPNEGYFRAEGGSQGEKATIVFREGDLPSSFDYRTALVAIWAGAFPGGGNYDWWETLSPIAHIEWKGRTLTLESATWWNPSKGNRFYVLGSKAFLDRPGEWHLDRGEGILYYRPRKLPIEQQRIVAPRSCRVLEIESDSQTRPVENLVFKGLVISQSDHPPALAPGLGSPGEAMVHLNNARNIVIEDCRLRNGGLNGIGMEGFNQDHRITGCLIEGMGFCGIMVVGFPPGAPPFRSPEEAYVSKRITISNNYIRSCGRWVGHGSGIWIYQSGDNEVSHNLIEDMPRYGVHLLATSYEFLKLPRERGGFGETIYGRKVTWENHTDFVYVRNNRIRFNEIRDVMKNSQDGGAIYSWGTGKGNLLEGNLIHSLTAFYSDHYGMIVGIYCDDAAKHFTIRGNMITRMRGPGAVYPLLIKGVHNLVSNNIIADNEASASIYVAKAGMSGLPDSIPGVKDEPVEDMVFTRNIVYQKGGAVVYMCHPWTDNMIRKSDFNLIYHPGGSYQVVIDGAAQSWKTWTEMLRGRFDRHTIRADPEFVASERMDYRLRPGSPGFKLGFVNPDLSAVGLMADFPFLGEVRKADQKYRR